MMLRFGYLIGIVVASVFFPWWLVLVLCMPYVYLYTAYELCMVMVLIDGYYGVLGGRPVLSMMLIGMFIIVESIKPFIYLRFERV